MGHDRVGRGRSGLGPPVAFSVLLHATLLFVLAALPGSGDTARVERPAAAERRPVEVSFAPLREPEPPQPAARPGRERRRDEARLERPAPPPARAAPSRAETPSLSSFAAESPGRGAAGGPAAEPAEGSPEAEPGGGAGAERSRSLLARLRDFESSLAEKGLAPPGTPRGGGKGFGGLDLRDLPQTGFGVGNLEFETGSYDWADYGRQVYWIIWRAWHNRLYLTVDNFEKWAWNGGFLLDHRSRIRFTIEANGDISDIALETPSGCAPLDRSAADALSEAVLPPLPPDFPKGRETVRARFIARGDIRYMRPTLQYLKGKGYF